MVENGSWLIGTNFSAGEFDPSKWWKVGKKLFSNKKTPVPNNAGFVARPKGVKSFGNLPCQKKIMSSWWASWEGWVGSWCCNWISGKMQLEHAGILVSAFFYSLVKHGHNRGICCSATTLQWQGFEPGGFEPFLFSTSLKGLRSGNLT